MGPMTDEGQGGCDGDSNADGGPCGDARWFKADAILRGISMPRRNQPTARMKDTPDMTERSDADDARRVHLNNTLLRVARGEQEAFAHFYTLTASRVFAVIVRILHNRDEAEDMLQEVYTNAWRRADSFDPARGSAMTWLITLARNRAIDHMRRHREEPLDEQKAAEIEDESPTPADAAEWSEERRRLERCLAALDPQQVGVVREAFFTGATYAELAERLRVPLGTMKSWIRRSLMQLRTCLER
ncbi:RNA polymerase sigma factor (sigma-70 family) [Paraburkholderia sp. WSM4175]